MVVAICPFLGGEVLNFTDIVTAVTHRGPWNADSEIFFFHRLPRVILAFLAGSALGLTGAVFQAILRNPLATPYTLGITGGGSLGAVIAITVPNLYFSWGIFNAVQLLSLVGSTAAMAFIYFLARTQGRLSMNSLLLAGISVSIFSGAMILFLRYLANPNFLLSVERWLMGGLDVTGFNEIALLFPLYLPGIGLLFLQMRSLNQLTLGDEIAAGYGVDVKRVQQCAFIGGSLATAGVVAVAGPIGFIGLVVPHIVRRLSGVNQVIVLPASFIAGGAFLVACDTMARTMFYPREIPVGIITALIGVPIFIHLLIGIRR